MVCARVSAACRWERLNRLAGLAPAYSARVLRNAWVWRGTYAISVHLFAAPRVDADTPGTSGDAGRCRYRANHLTRQIPLTPKRVLPYIL